ncbi:MAG: DUF6691 family protein [bacterium]
MNSRTFTINAVGLISGFLLATGLGIGGLTRPDRIIGAFDITGSWDPTMPLFFVVALTSYHLAYRWTLPRNAPVIADSYSLPTRKDLDARLIFGSLLFGAGWGLGGICPGPSITSLASGQAPFVVFFLSMAGSFFAFDALTALWRRFQGGETWQAGPTVP